jgi:tRNA dimethylallyltransferase
MSSSAASGGSSLRVICGPTGAGKSALALAFAQQRGLTIVSADSRQVYRGFDIGTAKPTKEERERVPHLGIDLVEPTERFSAAAWAEQAREWMSAANAAGRPPVIVGGTGFYIRALTEPLFAEPPLDPDRRAALAAELDELDTAALRERVRRLDPLRAHLGRAQLLRAVEVAELTGRPISSWYAGRGAPEAPPVRARYLLVDPGAPLGDWIAARVLRMFDEGWAEEVARLVQQFPSEAPAWNATGYAVVRDVVDAVVDREEAEALITIATRQYAKRQRTWFRHQIEGEDVTRIDPRDPGAANAVLAWWDADDSGGHAA